MEDKKLNKPSNTQVKDSLNSLNLKLELLIKMQDERIRELQNDIKDMKLDIQRITTDHENRLRTLEATQHYTRGVIGVALLAFGATAATLFKSLLGI